MEPSDVPVIAIDGPAGSGKSTVAPPGRPPGPEVPGHRRDVPGGGVRRHPPGPDPVDAEPVAALATHVDLVVGDDAVVVDGSTPRWEIRGPEVSRAVSVVAANPAVP